MFLWEYDLVSPIKPFLFRFTNIWLQILHRLTPVDEDRESLQQVVGLLQPLQMELKQTVGSLPKKWVLLIQFIAENNK